MKRLAVSVLLVVVLAGGAAGAIVWMIRTRPRPETTIQPDPVPTVLAPPIAGRKDYRVRIEGYGSVRPRVMLRIAPEVAGRIVAKAANFLSGRHVEQGQMLLEIDPTDYLLARDAAQRQIDLLEVNLKRLDVEEANFKATEKIESARVKLAAEQLAKARTLLTRGAAGQNDVDAAEEATLLRRANLQSVLSQLALMAPQRAQLQAQIAAAKVQLAQAVTSLGRTKVTSPVAGRLLSCSAEIGERVAVGQVCCELYGTALMEVPVAVPADDVAWLDEIVPASTVPVTAPIGAAAPPSGGIPAEVVWREPGTGREVAWQGYVGRLEAGVTADTRTATIVVEVYNPPPEAGRGMLDVNMFCHVAILGRRVAEAYLLPRSAILPDGSVYVARDGKLASRTVRPVRLSAEEAMLLPGGGVEEGDRVIVGYIPRPVEGMRVHAVDELRQGDAASVPASAPAPASAPGRR